MGVLLIKPGAIIGQPTPAGFRLLGSLDRVARSLPFDLTITCGVDSHPPEDPHSRGCAYDVRTHGLTEEQKEFILRAVLMDLREGDPDELVPVSIGVAISRFYAQLEHPGESGEHLHIQLRHGVAYP